MTPQQRKLKEARWQLKREQLEQGKKDLANAMDPGQRAALREWIEKLESQLEQIARELRDYPPP